MRRQRRDAIQPLSASYAKIPDIGTTFALPLGNQPVVGAKAQGKQPPQNEGAKTKLTEYNAPKGEFNDEVFPALITELNDLRGKLSFASMSRWRKLARKGSTLRRSARRTFGSKG